MRKSKITVTLTERELALLIDAVLGKIEAVTKTRAYLAECPEAMEAIIRHGCELRDLNTKLCKLGEED